MPTRTQHSTQIWNPTSIFSIINPAKGFQTCVGHTLKKDRCRNRILESNRDRVRRILDDMAKEMPSFSEMEGKLNLVASLCLCKRFHQGQASRIIGRWKHLMDQEETRLNLVFRQSTPVLVSRVSVRDAEERPISRDRGHRYRSRSTIIYNELSTPTGLNTETSAQQINTQHRTPSQNVDSEPALSGVVSENEIHSAATTSNNPEATISPSAQTASDCTITHVVRRSKDEVCVICTDYCTSCPLIELVWCKSTCGRNMHKSCFDQWRHFATMDGGQLRCPICRGTWQAECSHDEKEAEFEIWSEDELGLERLFSRISL